MGIPHLFRHLAHTYPYAVRVVPPQRTLPHCDALYIDFNGIIHESARDLPSSHRDDQNVVAASIDRLDRLVARLQPRCTLFVAVDGAPPRAKMNQQRARRYMAAWRHGALTIPQWDTNAITPGTAFMELLSDALYEWVHSKRLPSDVTVSDAAQKGEGEQKLFSAIRNSPSSSNSIYVYGLDADLILMAMRCPARDRMYIVREQAEALQLIDIKKLAEGVAKDMAMPALDSDVDIVGARLRDFAALCALLGNDFVPALPGLRIREGAVRLLVGAYKRARSCMGNGSRLASDAGPDILGGLDVRLLGALLREVALREGELLAAADKRYYQRVRWAASAPAALLADPEEVYPAMHPPQFGPDAVRPGDGSAWRLRYYHHVFGGVSNAASVRATCLQYLCGLGWTLCYLGDQRCLSEGWCYDMHAHAPTAHDMCNLLMDDGLSREVEEVMEATHRAHRDAASAGGPQWPLLMVLPPASANLIRDAALRALITDPRYAHAFPTGFKLDTYLKDRLWECHPVLPPLFCWPASHG